MLDSKYPRDRLLRFSSADKMGGKKQQNKKLRQEQTEPQEQEMNLNGEEAGPNNDAAVVQHGKIKEGQGKVVAQGMTLLPTQQ